MTLRRRLLLFSAPVAIIMLIAAAKMVSVVIAGSTVASDYADRDTDGMRSGVDTLSVLNVIEPARASFADGALAVLDNRLDDADARFSAALAQTEPGESCAVRVNLELVRETLGDRAAGALDGNGAVAWYRSALGVVDEAPAGCFAGNTDPDEERRAVRGDAAPRLEAKIAAAEIAPPPPPPPPGAAGTPPPPPPGGQTSAPDETELRLNPKSGDPLERLQQILRDAATR